MRGALLRNGGVVEAPLSLQEACIPLREYDLSMIDISKHIEIESVSPWHIGFQWRHEWLVKLSTGTSMNKAPFDF